MNTVWMYCGFVKGSSALSTAWQACRLLCVRNWHAYLFYLAAPVYCTGLTRALCYGHLAQTSSSIVQQLMQRLLGEVT